MNRKSEASPATMPSNNDHEKVQEKLRAAIMTAPIAKAPRKSASVPLMPAPFDSHCDDSENQRQPSQWEISSDADKKTTPTTIHGRTYRLSISVPKLASYQVDAVLNLIAAIQQPHDCNNYCGNCNIHYAYRRRSDLAKPACFQTIAIREGHLTYLCKQLVKSIERGVHQVWNKALTEARDLPMFRPFDHPTYQVYKWWTESSYFFPEDLARFCAYEKIRLDIVGYLQPEPAVAKANELAATGTSSIQSDAPNLLAQDAKPLSPVTASDDLHLEEGQACSVAKTHEQASTTPNSGDDNFLQPAQENVKQRRFDKIGAEIDEIMASDRTLTPTQVMRVLISRAGQQNSSVVANDGDSVRWEDAHGRKKVLAQDMLNDRVRRWHIAHNIPNTPDVQS